jgi:hypothetical protein
MKVSGTETPNHRARSAIRVVKGTAAELPLLQRIRFITKNKQNTTLKQENFLLFVYKTNIQYIISGVSCFFHHYFHQFPLEQYNQYHQSQSTVINFKLTYFLDLYIFFQYPMVYG